ncbi:diacylglycerol kinase [Pseudoalteromonas sp. MMG005]|uniref:diacylglycerol kinase n=1 Tax=Pseudoalteromonas sp. MMG005 TaxID=2822682 RepID=UPI001B3A0E17|nr:diacylglycerol kinase [Pseudoalteromonas sp. MMG005]MBQ4848467.1 diacylglycerol kinase [Pseudoalteromonas sp. MMG005]
MAQTSKPNGTGVVRIINATRCSIEGLIAAYQEEAAFRQELYLILILFPCSFFVAKSITHWALLISVLLLVLIAELLNSAIEALTDRVSKSHHVLSGRAKDMGSAAVTLTLVIVALIWGSAAVDYFI